MKKRQNKYLVTVAQRDQLIEDAQRHMEPDREIGPEGRVQVVTQYFDSRDRDCYWERIHRLKSRRRIRVRFLDEAGPEGERRALVSIKQKRGRVSGERTLAVPVEVAERFAAGDREPLRGLLDEVDRGGRMVIHEIFDIIERLGHEPTVQVRFDRSAYTTPDQTFRLNVDSDVVCPIPSEGGGEIVDPGLAVVEATSLGAVPTWFSDFITGAGLKRQRFSKYAEALKRYDPVLRDQLSKAETET